MGLFMLAVGFTVHHFYTTVPVETLHRFHGPAITFGWAVVLWGWYAVFRFLDTSTYPAVAAARKNCKLLSKNKEPPFWTMAQNNIRNHIMSFFIIGGYFNSSSHATYANEIMATTQYRDSGKWFLCSLFVQYIVYDVMMWIGHRIMHEAPVYAAVHKLHHCSYATSAICCHYMTIIDYWLEMVLPGMATVIASDYLGLAPGALLAFMIGGSTNGAVVHSGWKIVYGGLPLLVDAESHFWHHHRHKCNYSIGACDTVARTLESMPAKLRAPCDKGFQLGPFAFLKKQSS